MVSDYVYVLDDSLGRISYWNFNSGVPSVPIWTYGTSGSSTGQFRRPTGVCVSRTPGGSGGTLFTTVFFVVDRGNKRVVRLFRNGTTVTWSSTYTQADWEPADCAVDHYGQLYVTDASKNRLFKFTQYLTLLDTYGAYGTGPGSLNTFAAPGAISVPCGLKTAGSTTVWYCEGRVITAERWSGSTGAVEHYLGVKSQFTSQPTSAEGSASAFIKSTEITIATVRIHRRNVGIVRTLQSSQLTAAGGVGWYWDGLNDAGTPVPDDSYRFQVTLLSPYGCPDNFAYPWCSTTLYGNYFTFHYCVPDGGGGGTLSIADPIEPNALPGPPICGSTALAASTRPGDAVPESFAVRQLPGRVDGIPPGLSRAASHPAYELAMSVRGTPVPFRSDRIAEVRAAGVTALQVNLPRLAEVRIRVVDLQGRLMHDERITGVEAGVLVYRWDGRGLDGRRAPPGVYIAQVSAAGNTGRSKLIVTIGQE